MKINLLVAGGCHVTGYPIGDENSFANIAGDMLGRSGSQVKSTKLSHVTLAHKEKLIGAVIATAPTVLVLQLGNYETTVTFRQYFRDRLGRPKGKSSDLNRKLDAESCFHRSTSWRLKCTIKMLCDRLLRHPLLNMSKLAGSLSGLFGELSTLDLEQVIVLSPLPCADPLYMSYRVRLASIMKDEAEKQGFEYIDVLDRMSYRHDIFADPTHLNRSGHEMIASVIAQAIFRVQTPQVGASEMAVRR